jgi:tRNA dimethylallyltransferase
LEQRKVEELFEILAQLDASKAASLNVSDKKNPRRLVRAIEVAVSKVKMEGFKKNKTLGVTDHASVLFVGLIASKKVLEKLIKLRIQKRLSAGLEREIRGLLSTGVHWDNQSMNTLGYKHWRKYLEKTQTKKDIVLEWFVDEKNYTKRQLTWFKKDKRIKWFDITRSNYLKDVEMLVRNWYYNKKGNVAKD